MTTLFAAMVCVYGMCYQSPGPDDVIAFRNTYTLDHVLPERNGQWIYFNWTQHRYDFEEPRQRDRYGKAYSSVNYTGPKTQGDEVEMWGDFYIPAWPKVAKGNVLTFMDIECRQDYCVSSKGFGTRLWVEYRSGIRRIVLDRSKLCRTGLSPTKIVADLGDWEVPEGEWFTVRFRKYLSINETGDDQGRTRIYVTDSSGNSNFKILDFDGANLPRVGDDDCDPDIVGGIGDDQDGDPAYISYAHFGISVISSDMNSFSLYSDNMELKEGGSTVVSDDFESGEITSPPWHISSNFGARVPINESRKY